MSVKAVVLDANILIRAVLGKRVREIVFNNAPKVNFFAPDPKTPISLEQALPPGRQTALSCIFCKNPTNQILLRTERSKPSFKAVKAQDQYPHSSRNSRRLNRADSPRPSGVPCQSAGGGYWGAAGHKQK